MDVAGAGWILIQVDMVPKLLILESCYVLIEFVLLKREHFQPWDGFRKKVGSPARAENGEFLITSVIKS